MDTDDLAAKVAELEAELHDQNETLCREMDAVSALQIDVRRLAELVAGVLGVEAAGMMERP